MSEPPLPTDMPVEPIPGYRLTKPLGKGGFGEVWEASGPRGFRVALKFVTIGTPVGDHELRSLEVVKDIRHAHLLAMFGAWEVAGRLVVAMELADRTLLDRWRETTRQGQRGIPGRELWEYMREAAKGIDFLNEPRHQGEGTEPVSIQHRDVKPQNLLLVGGSVKVGDFGLARVLEHSVTCHSGGLTPAYAAPEFFEGHTASQSDQYSLAVTYCHLRGGRRPFEGDAAALMAGHLHREPDLTMLPSVERAAAARALAKTPSERWPNCQAFVRALTDAGGPELVEELQSGSIEPDTAADPSDLVLRRLRSKRVPTTPGRETAPIRPAPRRFTYKWALLLIILILPVVLFFVSWLQYGIKIAVAVTLAALPVWPLGVRSGIWLEFIDLVGREYSVPELKNNDTELRSKRWRLLKIVFNIYLLLTPLVGLPLVPSRVSYHDRHGSNWDSAPGLLARGMPAPPRHENACQCPVKSATLVAVTPRL